MHKLILKGGTSEREFALREETIIGRASESTIRIENNKVDDRHAKVCRIGGNIFVEDLDSTQGISVNGRKVARWRLKKGDVIEVGGTQLLYDEDDKPEPPPPEAKPAAPAKAAATAGAKSSAAIAPAKSNAASTAKPSSTSSTGTGAAKTKSAVGTAVNPVEKSKAASPGAAVQTPPGGAERPSGTGKPSSAAPAPAGNSLSKVGMPAVKPTPAGASSARIPVPKMVVPGANSAISPVSASNVQPVPRNSASAISMNPNSPIAQASIAASSARLKIPEARTPASEEAARTQKFLLYAVAGLALLVLVMGGALLVIMTRKSAQMTIEQAALARVKQKGPKSPRDVELLNSQFMAIKTKAKLLEMLGEPDLTFKDKITIFGGTEVGTQDLLGPEFIVYYVNEENVVELGPFPDVLIFEIRGDKASYVGVRLFSRNVIAPVEPTGNGPPKTPMPMPSGQPPNPETAPKSN